MRSLRDASCCSVEVVRSGRAPRVRLRLNGSDRCCGILKSLLHRASIGLVQGADAVVDTLRLQLTAVCKVATSGDTGAVERDEFRRELLGQLGEPARDVPIGRGHEGHALALAVHHEASSHRLHTTRRQPRSNLAPQQRRDLVTNETIKNTARLLRIHQLTIKIPRVI